MGEKTEISWCDHTFNPWIGCTKVGPACDGCYADALMGQTGRYKRATWGGPGVKSVLTKTAPSTWKLPRKWDREAAKKVEAWRADPFDNAGLELPKPTTFVFCASLADVFDKDADPAWRRELFDLIRATPNLTWLLLTKRPGMIVKLFADTLPPEADKRDAALREAWPRNAAILCTVVTQGEADSEVPKLLAAKAILNPAFAGLSIEPMLEAIDLTFVADTKCPNARDGLSMDPSTGAYECCSRCDWTGLSGEWGLDWIIAGGETDQGGHEARPAHPDWIRKLRDDCAAADVPFHFKQWGEWREARRGDIFDTSKGRAAKPPALIVDPKDGSVHCFLPEKPHADLRVMIRVGKKAAGRLLDGVLHDARPEIRP